MKIVCMDSTLIIDFLKNKPVAVEQLTRLKRESIPCTTSINVFEVMYGLLRKKDNRAIEIAEEFFSTCTLFAADAAASKKSAAIAAELADKGMMINPFDTLIAGTMLMNGCQTIATADIKDFQRIKEITVF